MTPPTRESRYTGSSGLCLILLGSLREQGYDPQVLLDQLQLRLRDLLSLESRVPLSLLHQLWRAAEGLTGDEALGITVASRVDPQANMSWPAPFSLHEHVGRASPTMRASILHQSRMLRLLRDAHSISVDDSGEHTLVRFDFALPEEPRSLIHFHMAAGILFSRRILSGSAPGTQEVTFKHAAPRNVAPFQRFFDCPLRFDADDYAFVVDGALLDQPLSTSNPIMLEMLEHRARKAVEALPAIDDFVELVRERIEAELPNGNTNARSVAEHLGISQRTLHRRLQAEATSYQELLDKVRCRLAQRHLASRKHTINEVAALVGFAQPSAFHRAFKGWTGDTPADYQERHASPKSVPPPAPSRR